MSTLDPRRDFDVTASDVPTICGECPYSNRRSVLYKKSLRLRSVDTPATLHGRQHEPIAIKKFCEKTGAKVELDGAQSVYKKHPVYTWLGGTVDGIATFPDGKRMILEVKCPISRTIKGDEIPIHYIGQVLLYYLCVFFDTFFLRYRPICLSMKWIVAFLFNTDQRVFAGQNSCRSLISTKTLRFLYIV